MKSNGDLNFLLNPNAVIECPLKFKSGDPEACRHPARSALLGAHRSLSRIDSRDAHLDLRNIDGDDGSGGRARGRAQPLTVVHITFVQPNRSTAHASIITGTLTVPADKSPTCTCAPNSAAQECVDGGTSQRSDCSWCRRRTVETIPPHSSLILEEERHGDLWTDHEYLA